MRWERTLGRSSGVAQGWAPGKAHAANARHCNRCASRCRPKKHAPHIKFQELRMTGKLIRTSAQGGCAGQRFFHGSITSSCQPASAPGHNVSDSILSNHNFPLGPPEGSKAGNMGGAWKQQPPPVICSSWVHLASTTNKQPSSDPYCEFLPKHSALRFGFLPMSFASKND